MEKVPQFIIDTKDEEIAIVEDTDLKNLFNLTYSFDLLQSTITLLFKNQEKLENKIFKANEINNEQNKKIESLQKYIRDNCATKKEFNYLENKINELNKKISEIDDELVKSN
jgi:predicted RNase H-like nuclease (RuvC/YqgF family)